MATVTTYDSMCFDLAEAFLADENELNTPAARHALALEIQQCIEDEIYFMRNAPDLYGKPAPKWDEGEHEGCGKDSERALAQSPTITQPGE